MKILDKYLFLNIAKPSILILFALVFIFAFFQFIEELDEIGKERYTLEVAIKYITLLIPSIFNSLVVLSLMIGTVISIGKLNSNKELQIFHTASISQRQMVEKTIKYPFLLSIALIIFFELIAPQALIYANQIKDQSLGISSYQETNEAWFKNDNEILFLKKDKNNKYYLRLFVFKDKNLLSYTDGKGAFFLGTKLVTKDSRKIEFQDNNKFAFPKESLSNGDVKINLKFEEVESLSKNVKTMSFFELLKIISFSNHNQNYKNEIILEIFSRAIKPFTLIGMILLAVPYIMNIQRNVSIGKRILLSIVIGTITHLITKITSVISLKFDSMFIVGPILPTLILILAGVLILKIKTKV